MSRGVVNVETQDVPATKHQGANPCPQALSNRTQKRKYKRYCKPRSTYVGLIANIIQGSPDKRLTFCQIMDKLQPVISGDREGIINNVRVCLSSNHCFVKVPVNPENPKAQKNFWKIDETRLTPQQLRRHFKGMEHIFPELASRTKRDACANGQESSETSGGAPASSVARESCAVRFSGPFSIESLLKNDSSQSAAVHHEQYSVCNSPEGVTEEPSPSRGTDTNRKANLDRYAYDLPESRRVRHCAPSNTVVTGPDAIAQGTGDDVAMLRNRFSLSSYLTFTGTTDVAFQFHQSFVTQPNHLFFYYPRKCML